MVSLKELSKKQDLLVGGHRACAGCAAPSAIRQILLAAEEELVIGFATGCMEVVTTIYPYTSWKIPYIHNAFENVAATISGVETAYRALKKKGKMDKEVRFIAFAGDGGTYDIGLQSLSGAMERGHKMLYVCYDNEAYMNTGIQRSSATPFGAATSTTPAGKVIVGNQSFPKDLTAIMVAHNIPYVAQATPSHYNDLMTKVKKALAADGPSFINILAPCHRGWRFPMEKSIELARLAVETGFWPLFEVENGKWNLTKKVKTLKPLEEWFKLQGRFRHLFKEENRHIIEKNQEWVNKRWEELLIKCNVS